MLLSADAPAEYADDPAALWRAALNARKRVDEQPARLVELTIPDCIESPADRLDFARHVAAPWLAEGRAVQIDLHNPLRSDGSGLKQPHAHLILSRRALSADGFSRGRMLDDSAWQPRNIVAQRAAIADRMNQWLSNRGYDVYVDHRSYRDRGDPTPPERNVSRAAWEAHKHRPGSAAAQPAAEAIAARPVRRQLRAARRAAAQSAQEAATLAARHERQALALRPLGRRPGLPWIEVEHGGPVVAVRRRADAVALQLRDGGAVVIQRPDVLRFRGAVTAAALAVAAERCLAVGWTEVTLSGTDPGQRDRLAAALAARGITIVGETRPPSRAAVAAAEAYLAATRQPPAAPAEASPPTPPAPAAAPPRQASPTPLTPLARQPVPPRPAPRRAPPTAPSPTAPSPTAAPTPPAATPVAPTPAYRPPWITSPGRRSNGR